MRILAARKAAGAIDAEKSQSTAQTNELSYNGEFAGSTDHDAMDMRKLGVQQETKVTNNDGRLRWHKTD